MYTTNAIESLNSGFRRPNRGRTIFPAQGALPGNLGTDGKMGHACLKLGPGLRGSGRHVPRQVDPELGPDRDRKGGRAFNRSQP